MGIIAIDELRNQTGKQVVDNCWLRELSGCLGFHFLLWGVSTMLAHRLATPVSFRFPKSLFVFDAFAVVLEFSGAVLCCHTFGTTANPLSISIASIRGEFPPATHARR
jgi:hypothetical protein